MRSILSVFCDYYHIFFKEEEATLLLLPCTLSSQISFAQHEEGGERQSLGFGSRAQRFASHTGELLPKYIQNTVRDLCTVNIESK